MSADEREQECLMANRPQNFERELKKNLVAFWFFGLCNNFGYVVMLSAAFDILQEQSGHKKEIDSRTGFHCNPMSTGYILLADILPTLIIKWTAPFYIQRINYHLRVAFVIVLSICSLLTVAYSQNIRVSILGVVFASISAGFGEITFLSISAHFQKEVISAWSSGTGMAGVSGALAYAGLTQLGLSSRNTILVLLVVPLVWAINFWLVLKFPSSLRFSGSSGNVFSALQNDAQDKTQTLSLKEKMKLLKPLLRYMLPLFFVYMAEYTINQGLYELLYYNTWLSQADQYRWFQVDYQIGVFISRSSLSILKIKQIFIPALLQCCLFAFILLEVYFTFLPSIWIMFAVVLFEGLLGGCVYVNAFYLILKDVQADFREFSMGVASVADSTGITIAAFISIPLHNSLCHHKTL